MYFDAHDPQVGSLYGCGADRCDALHTSPRAKGGEPLGAVIVLFNPSPEQLARLPAVAAQCSFTVVVDNSLEPQADLQQQLQASGVTLLVNRNAGGIAGALNRGMARLAQQGAAAFLLLDQDSVLPAGYAAHMARACLLVGTERYILGPRVFDVNAQETLPSFSLSRFMIRRVDVARADAHAGLLPCSFVIASGCVVSLAAYRSLGGMREDFVIDHVDTEYCVRAARAGVTVACVPGLTLRHAIGRRESRRVLGLRVGAMNHDARRRYYLARNAVALTWLHGARFPALVAVNLLTLSQCLAVLLVESDKAAKLTALCVGLFDGLRRRSGPFEVRHPRLAARCHMEPRSRPAPLAKAA